VTADKGFRTDLLAQGPLPPSPHNWLPERDPARFLIDVIEELDPGARLFTLWDSSSRSVVCHVRTRQTTSDDRLPHQLAR
jgi:hypothetical protein